jgi:nitrate reductase NapE component
MSAPGQRARPVSDDHAGAAAETQRARRFGWASLLLWVVLGLALEGAHGFKVSAYLDDSLRRNLLRLAHAHGVILALIVLAYSQSGAPLLASRTARVVGRLLRASALMIPLGFSASSLGASESDPSLAILLVPAGASLLLAALGRIVWAAWRQPPPVPPADAPTA